MIGRIVAAIAFIAGGAVTVFLLALLMGFAASQAGMSASAVLSRPAVDAFIPWFAGSCFLVSAIAVIACRSRVSLQLAALIAHSLLLLTFLAICAEGVGEGGGKFLGGLLTLSFITLLYFSPWFAIWAAFLLRKTAGAQRYLMDGQRLSHDPIGERGGNPNADWLD